MNSMKEKERRGNGSGKPLWTRFFVFVPVWQKTDSAGKTRDRHPETRTEKTRDRHPEALRLLELYAFLKELKHADHYIAGSDYRDRIGEFSGTLTFFRNLESAGTFAEFCRREGWRSERSQETVRRILLCGENPERIVRKLNEQFLTEKLAEEKEYLDHILDPVDPAISLDENQRRVILADEDYMLVIAGAGAGKTTTLAAKVRYLVERQGVPPESIFVVSFTNKAVGELRTHINRELQIPCPIGTFHAAGNTILRREAENRPEVVDGSALYRVARNYLTESVMRDARAVHDLLLFFGTYFDAPYEGADMQEYFTHLARENRSTLKSDLDEYERKVVSARSRRMMTLRAEILRSHEEVEIANFLYLNGIDYFYEEIYPYYLPGTNKPYTPDFLLRQGDLCVWLEHFGISEDGENDRYSKEELARYIRAANNKFLHHRAHGTKLIYTYSSYRDGRSRMEHLREKLVAAGFTLHPVSEADVLGRLTRGDGTRYMRRMIVLICRFLVNFKTNGFGLSDFERMRQSTDNVRSRLFLRIARDVYIEYQRYLEKTNSIDFQDMINESAALLRRYKENEERLNFRYILVDEYQDISRQRFDLVRALHEISDARIVAVGDDWQSIYAFSGSDITLFTQFTEKMGYAKSLTIDRTYRNSQELIDMAGGFIQKNSSQIKKALISDRHIKDPVIIYTYDGSLQRDRNDEKSGVNYAIAKCVENAIGQILAYAEEEKRVEREILLIGRFGFDGRMMEHTGLFDYLEYGNRLRCRKYPDVRISFMTAHSSKGLSFDDVIVLNGKNERYGFPAKIEDDPVLGFVTHEDRTIEYAEERRLFYVAMTRTRNRGYFIAPEQNPSEFLLELRRDYKTIPLRGKWNEAMPDGGKGFKPCPVCGYPLQLRMKTAYGLRLYICTNDPEICDFMTNDVAGGKLAIRKCSCCRDGFLIVRSGRNGSHFLGCTNYRPDGKGCNNTSRD